MSEGRLSSRYNGGISLAIAPLTGTWTYGTDTVTSVDIPTVTSYEPSLETVSESFETADYTTYTTYVGDRFSANITTGVLTFDQMKYIRWALMHHEFKLGCPEYPTDQGGINVRLTSLSQPLEVANYGGKYYRLNFAVAAVALVNGGSG